MKLKHIAALLALAAASAAAQQAVLIEACNSITDPARRLECLKAAIATQEAKPAAQDPASAELERAFVAVYSGVEGGTSLLRYQASLGELNRALAQLERTAVPAQRPGIREMQSALEVYGDAGTLWSRAIDFYVRGQNAIMYARGLPLDMVGLNWIASKYSLQTVPVGFLGAFTGLPYEPARSTLWGEARTRGERAMALIRNPAEAFVKESAPVDPASAASPIYTKGAAGSAFTPSLPLTVGAALEVCSVEIRNASMSKDVVVPNVDRSGPVSGPVLQFKWGGSSPLIDERISGSTIQYPGECAINADTGYVTTLVIDGVPRVPQRAAPKAR